MAGIWTTVEKSAPFRRGKLIVRRLAGRELWLQPEPHARPVLETGWLYAPKRLSARSVVYSLGVGDDIGFDLALIRRFGLTVHAFDPIPSVADWIAARNDLPSQFHFHPWAAAAEDTTLKLYPRFRRSRGQNQWMYTSVADDGSVAQAIEVPARSLATMCRLLGHEHIDLLKVDVEGIEYAVLDSMLATRLRPTQVLVEFHHRFRGLAPAATERMARKLVATGYELLGISDSGREFCFCLPAA